MINQNKDGYNEREKELNWAAAYAERELNAHKKKNPIDHPDGSVTRAKLASGVINELDGLRSDIDKNEQSISDLNDAVNARISKEVLSLKKTDTDILDKVNAEVADRKRQYNTLYDKITDGDNVLKAEIKEVQSVLMSTDSILSDNLDMEAAERQTVCEALSERITPLEKKAHIHENKNILDSITAKRVSTWDTISDQATRTEILNFQYGNTNEFRDLWTAFGIRCYDGGIFGMEYDGKNLDGGSFLDSEIDDVVDGGGFTPIDVITPITTELQEMSNILGTLNEELDAVNGGI